MQNTWIVLLPAFITLFVAITWRNVIAALLTGIFSASFIATDFSPIKAITHALSSIWKETQIQELYYKTESPDHVYTFIFLILLGIIISLITHTGGIGAYTKLIQNKITTKKNAQTASLLLSFGFFIDDYLNGLTVGSIIRPLTDKFKVARVKLAFLIDSISSPLCVLIPASSWVAMIISNLQAAGVSEQPDSSINSDPFSVYLASIPYLFYPIFIIFTSFFVVRRNISFGPMYVQEEIAQDTDNLFGGKDSISVKLDVAETSNGSIFDFLIPITLFISITVGLILYTGNWVYFGGTKTILKALQEAQIFYSLYISSIITFVLSSIYFFIYEKLTLKSYKHIIVNGFMLMRNSLVVLLFAWTLSGLLKNDLKTGQYLAEIILPILPITLLPVMVFLTSSLISATTGSSWGTIAVITPLTIPLITTGNTTTLLLLSPIIGAMLSGSISGSHLSPISDATVMSSMAAGSYHLDHVVTQLPYAVIAVLGAIIAYIISGFITGSFGLLLSLTSGLAFIAICLLVFNRNK